MNAAEELPLIYPRYADLDAGEARRRIDVAMSLLQMHFEAATADVIDVIRALEGWSTAEILAGRQDK